MDITQVQKTRSGATIGPATVTNVADRGIIAPGAEYTDPDEMPNLESKGLLPNGPLDSAALRPSGSQFWLYAAGAVALGFFLFKKK